MDISMRNLELRLEGASCCSARIEIGGGIAAGKTTLAKRIAAASQKIAVLYEDYESNSFLPLLYDDPVAHAMEAEIAVLNQHASQIAADPFGCFDFSLVLDIAYAEVTLSKEDFEVYSRLFWAEVGSVGLPGTLIYIASDATTQLVRIKERGRSMEQSLTVQYLSKINESTKRWLGRLGSHVQVIRVDGEREIKLDVISPALDKLMQARGGFVAPRGTP